MTIDPVPVEKEKKKAPPPVQRGEVYVERLQQHQHHRAGRRHRLAHRQRRLAGHGLGQLGRHHPGHHDLLPAPLQGRRRPALEGPRRHPRPPGRRPHVDGPAHGDPHRRLRLTLPDHGRRGRRRLVEFSHGLRQRPLEAPVRRARHERGAGRRGARLRRHPGAHRRGPQGRPHPPRGGQGAGRARAADRGRRGGDRPPGAPGGLAGRPRRDRRGDRRERGRVPRARPLRQREVVGRATAGSSRRGRPRVSPS